MDLTTTQKHELAAAVERGAAFFDEHRPGWRVELRQTINDTSPLHMDDCERCVVSRVLQTDYETGLAELYPDLTPAAQNELAIHYGFSLPSLVSTYQDKRQNYLSWRYLEECWLRKI